MKRLGSLAKLLCFGAILTGCEATSLTHGVCDGREVEFPREAMGLYYFDQMLSDPERSNSLFVERQYVDLRPIGNRLAVFVSDEKQVNKYRGDDWGGWKFCKIHDQFYMQEYFDGVFKLSRMDFRPDEMKISFVLFEPEDLTLNEIPFTYMPVLGTYSLLKPEENPFEFDFMSPVKMIVENENVEVEKLMGRAIFGSIGATLYRAPESSRIKSLKRVY